MAANDPNNIRLGPCRILWGGVDLGLTKGGVEVEVTTSSKEVVIDQFGETPINEYITGRKLMVKCPFAETDIDSLHRLMRQTGSALVTDGARATGTIAIATQPTANDTIVVNGTTFTFKAAATAVRDVVIGTNAAATVANLLSALQFSTDVNVAKATYSLNTASATTIDVVFTSEGTAGNAFTLAKTGSAVTVPATLTGGTNATRKRVEVSSGIGISIQQTAKELVLRPVEKADNDFTEDFVIPLAGTSGALSFAYKTNDERLFNLSFTGFINPATKVLFIYGDKRSS